jgi:multicomponent Na+:H+ antiporter subunit E
MNRFIARTVILFLFWVGLTASVHWEELLVGLISALVTSWASLKLVPDNPGERLSLISWMKFIPVLLWEIVVANIDVAKRVLAPKIRVNPGFVTIPTSLKSPRKKWFLAHAITLTPGTVTADIFEDSLLVHWIDVQEGTPEEHGKLIKDKFEKVLC